MVRKEMSDKRYGYQRLVLLVFVFILVNVCLDLCYYWNYQDKMNILERMLDADSVGSLDADNGGLLDAAAGILKSAMSDFDQGGQLLVGYGYGENGQNRFYVEFLKASVVTGIVSAVLLFCIWFVEELHIKRRCMAQEVYFWQLLQFLEGVLEGGTGLQQLPVLTDHGGNAMRVNEQLEQLQEYLDKVREQAIKDKEEVKRLVTDISHQLKTPVAALDTCFAVLQDDSLEYGQRQEFQQLCSKELDGLKILLDSLIQVSRLEAGMIQIEMVRAPVFDTVINAVNRVYPKACAKQMEFVFDHDRELERLEVMQDKKWLCEALINILDNAVKYSPAESEVCISMQQFVTFVRIEIADNGIGIPKQEYHKIFKRFYRVGDKRVQQESGSGVGLYLAREIIEKHHGMISVRSGHEKGRGGCRFAVQLPYCKTDRSP